ncbi:MFS transporter permease [Microbacterium sp. H1-D42]|uniref:MFS transporter permease n=1 Tax=Microbacterium sp. H1-D42 TaxID=2925844 RepID=UPI001F538C6F|nr:MFS transporter permease [Microbacterium sp. H1-D42]UNK69376.1 MFS transporter permease [Microbacterium sp. H1-D42]
MFLRRGFFRWLLPAAFVLPLWMIVGWAIFGQSGWGLLWVLLMAVPSVFVGQLVLTLLTRSRPSVRAERAVSWWDVLGFTVWHGLTIAVACFIDGAFPWLLTGAIVAALALFWLQLWQLWNEARGSGARLRETITWSSMSSSDRSSPSQSAADVIIIEEHRTLD